MVQKIDGDTEVLNRILQAFGLLITDLPELVEIKKNIPRSSRPSPGQSICIDEAIESFLSSKENMSELTIMGYRNDLNQFKEYMLKRWEERNEENLVVSNVLKSDIESFLNSLVPRRKQGTGKIKASAQNRKLATIRGLFKHLIDEEILLDSPAKSINWSREGTLPIMFLTKELQEKVLWTALRNRENGLRDFTIILLALNTGIRLCEIHLLNRSDIDMNKMTLKIIGKGKKYRSGVIHEDLLPSLNRYFEHIESTRQEILADEQGVPLFINEKGKYKGQRISRNSVEKMVTRVFRKCGIEEGSVHRLRHTFAVNCLEIGIEVVHIMRLLGHSNIATTVRYLRISEEMVLRQVRDNFPLAFISIDNISEHLGGDIGAELQKAIKIVKSKKDE